VVILLCNYHRELGEPFVIKKLACLHKSESFYEPELAQDKLDVVYVYLNDLI
jgi:hypothetical protein